MTHSYVVITLSYVPWRIHTCDTEPRRIRARTASTHEAFKSGAWLVYTFDTGPCGIRAGTASTHEPTYCWQRHHQSVTHSRQTFCLTQSWGSFSSLTHLFTLSHIVTRANCHTFVASHKAEVPSYYSLIFNPSFHTFTHRYTTRELSYIRCVTQSWGPFPLLTHLFILSRIVPHTNRNAFSSNILPHVKLRSLLICYQSFHVFTYFHPHILVKPTASRKAEVPSYLLPIVSHVHILSPTHSCQAHCLT